MMECWNNEMMGIQAEKMIFIHQKLLLTRLKSRRLAGKPITPVFHYSSIPVRSRPRSPACKPYGLEPEQGANCEAARSYFIYLFMRLSIGMERGYSFIDLAGISAP
jgi:hypothetical protein